MCAHIQGEFGASVVHAVAWLQEEAAVDPANADADNRKTCSDQSEDLVQQLLEHDFHDCCKSVPLTRPRFSNTCQIFQFSHGESVTYIDRVPYFH